MESMQDRLRVVKEGTVWKIYGLLYGMTFMDARENRLIGEISYDRRFDAIYFRTSPVLIGINFNTVNKLPQIMTDYNYEVLGRIERIC